MKRVRAGTSYIYEAAGIDLWDSRTDLTNGEVVRVVNLHGCPPANTMGHCHVNRADGSWGGLVACCSLQPRSH